jgi:hypothetical protein
VVDAALLLKSGAADDEDLSARATSCGLSTALWVLLQLQTVVAGVRVPAELEEEIRPSRFKMRCFRAFDFERMAFGEYGKQILPRLLTTHGTGHNRGGAFRFVVPDRGRLLMLGHSPSDFPGLKYRLHLSFTRLRSLVKQWAQLLGRLARTVALSESSRPPDPDFQTLSTGDGEPAASTVRRR